MNKLIYMFKKDLAIYNVIIFIFIIDYLSASKKIFIFALVGMLIGNLFLRTHDRFNILLSFQISRKEYYTTTIIYNFLSSAIVSLTLSIIKVSSNSILKNYYKYIFLFYFILVLVPLSIKLFDETFKHSDYTAVRFIVYIVYYVILTYKYPSIFFNGDLNAYENLKLNQHYIIPILIIGFNYITSYFVHKSAEVKIVGEAE